MSDTERKNSTIKSLEKDMKDAKAETDSRFESVEQSLSDLTNTLKESMGEVKGLITEGMANVQINMATPKGVNSEDNYMGLDTGELKFKDVGEHENESLIETQFTTVSSAEFQAKAEQLKFDTEIIEVLVMGGGGPSPDNTFTVSVNGISRMVERNKPCRLPRCYVEVLLRAKTSYYSNTEITNAVTGERSYQHLESRAHRYPLQILRDPSPKGRAWFERVNNEVKTGR